MVCCEPTRISFVNESSSTIQYTTQMQNTYGSKPRVFVYYYDDITGEFYQSNFFTVINYNITTQTITVDHGGPQTGFIIIR